MKHSFIIATACFALSLAAPQARADLLPWVSGQGGTEQQCRALTRQEMQKCFDKHEARPATEPKLAWQAGKWSENPRTFALCTDTHGHPTFKFEPIIEEFCGTEVYCGFFDTNKERVDGLFKSKQHCLKSHLAKP